MWGVNWQLVAASVEMGGALMAFFAALTWAFMTGFIWQRLSPTILLLSVALFAWTNANYALFQIVRYSMEGVDMFDTPYENVVLWMQQLATIVLPLSAISTWFMMSRTRLRRVR